MSATVSDCSDEHAVNSSITADHYPNIDNSSIPARGPNDAANSENESSTSTNHKPAAVSTATNYSGILYKRRDVFRSQWRPRYFVLNRSTGILSYYLINSSDCIADSSMHKGRDDDNTNTESTMSSSFKLTSAESSPNLLGTERGTIYLPGCTVESNDRMTKTGRYYVFTIISPQSDSGAGSICYLSTASEEEREIWVERIASACCAGLGRSISEVSAEDGAVTDVDDKVSSSLLEDSFRRRDSSSLEEAQTKPQLETATTKHDVKARDADQLRNETKPPPHPIPEPEKRNDVVTNPIHNHSLTETRSLSETESANEIVAPDRQTVHKHVPDDIRLCIEEKLRRSLELFDEKTGSGGPWKPHFKRKGVAAFQKRHGKALMIRSEATLSHHPKQILNLIVDICRRTDFESNVLTATRLKHINPHTFLDYYAYKPVWPTTARDFFVIAHWRVLPERNDSIIFFAFSHTDEVICPPVQNRIRADLILSCYLLEPGDKNSCFLKRILCTDLNGNLPSSVVNTVTQQQAMLPLVLAEYLKANESDPDTCLTGEGGDITNEVIANDIIKPIMLSMQTADDASSGEDLVPLPEPFDIAEDLTPVDDTAEDKFRDASIESTFVYVKACSLLFCVFIWCFSKFVVSFLRPYRGLLFSVSLTIGMLVFKIYSASRTVQQSSSSDDVVSAKIKQQGPPRKSPPIPRQQQQQQQQHLSLFSAVLILLFPTLTWYLATSLYPHTREFVFLSTLLLSIRFLTTRYLGPPMTYSDGTPVNVRIHPNLGIGLVTCRFSVDLKGVLRFIANSKESREATTNGENGNNPSDAEVAVTHIVVKAIARTLSEMNAFCGRKVCIPLLGIRGFYPKHGVAISVATGIHRSSSGSNRTVKLIDVDRMSIGDIANELLARSSNRRNDSADFASHRRSTLRRSLISVADSLSDVLGLGSLRGTLGDDKFGSCVVFTSPNSENSEVDIDVAPAVGGPNVVVVVGGVRVMRDVRRGSVRPMLSVSMTFDCPACNVASCRKFSERVQKLVQFPEVCED